MVCEEECSGTAAKLCIACVLALLIIDSRSMLYIFEKQLAPA